MVKMNLNNNLQQLMKIHGNISVSELARLTNIPQPTIHHILKGATKNPRKKALEALSEFFSVSIEQLMNKEPLPNIIPDIIKEDLQLKTIPIIQWDMLVTWPPQDLRNLQLKEIVLNKPVANNSFALIMQNESAELQFPENSLLIFDSGKNPKDRDFVIVYMRKENNILFNRLFIDNGVPYIKQHLSDGDFKLTKLDTDNDRIIGTLIEVRIEY